jgi:hypothetical protein
MTEMITQFDIGNELQRGNNIEYCRLHCASCWYNRAYCRTKYEHIQSKQTLSGKQRDSDLSILQLLPVGHYHLISYQLSLKTSLLLGRSWPSGTLAGLI